MRAWLFSILLAPWVLANDLYDQLEVHENACGPVAFMNAQQLSGEQWRLEYAKLPRAVNARFEFLYQSCFKQFSAHAYLKRRWDKKNGIRPDDLRDGINQLHRTLGLPKVALVSLFKQGEQDELIDKLARKTQGSLEHGFPPLLVLSRFQKIHYRTGAFRWGVVASHVVTVTELEQDGENLVVKYCDPWGARMLEGTLGFGKQQYFANDICAKPRQGLKKNPCLVADWAATPVTPTRATISAESVVVASHLIVPSVE